MKKYNGPWEKLFKKFGMPSEEAKAGLKKLQYESYWGGQTWYVPALKENYIPLSTAEGDDIIKWLQSIEDSLE
jgi:hypothetical protein